MSSLHWKVGAVTRAVTLVVDGAEGEIAQRLGEVQDRHPTVEIGSYPAFRGGKPSVSLVLRGTDDAELDAAEAIFARCWMKCRFPSSSGKGKEMAPGGTGQ